GNLIATTTTGPNGIYHFSNLTGGNYIVEFVNPNPALFRFTLPYQGDPALDSDAEVITGRSACITLATGETNHTIDAGFISTNCVPTCVIGAWSDPTYRPSYKPPGRNQAFWARGISTNLVFYPEPGSWVENPDG